MISVNEITWYQNDNFSFRGIGKDNKTYLMNWKGEIKEREGHIDPMWGGAPTDYVERMQKMLQEKYGKFESYSDMTPEQEKQYNKDVATLN